MDLYNREERARERARRAIQDEKNQSEGEKEDKARKDEENRIHALITSVNEHALKAARAKEILNDIVGRIEGAAGANPDMDTSNPLQLVGRLLVVVFGIAGAFLLDYFLFSSFTAYIVETLGGVTSFLWVARIVVPMVIVAIELALAALIYDHRRKGNVFAAWAFTAVAAGTLVALSSMTTATLLAGQEVTSFAEMSFIELLLLIPMMLFSALPHAILLFSGRIGHEGKAHVWIILRRRKARKVEKPYLENADKAVAVFTDCGCTVRAFNRRFKRNMRLLPEMFTLVARLIINERLGYEAIGLPQAIKNRSNGVSTREAVEDDQQTLKL